jgi:hypothetical protein
VPSRLYNIFYYDGFLLYRGLVVEQAEREVIAKDLGPNNKVRFPFIFHKVKGAFSQLF